MIANVLKRSWIALLPLFCSSLFIFMSQSSAAQSSKTGKLTIEIAGIRNTEGNIRVALRTDETTYIASKVVAINPTTLTAEAVFEELPEGNYSVVVIHDENKNEKLDFNDTGVPIEGYGHSNNPAKRPGPPDFSETKFAFSAPGSTMEIKLVYWL